jgi:hypothetical protein
MLGISKVLDAAVKLADTGIPAFPVLANKHPATPDWLLAEFQPKPRPSIPASPTIRFCTDNWLRGLVRTVASASEGQRNSILFWASCRAGEALRDGKATEDFLTSVLLEAAMHAGLPQREALRTIISGVQRT